jgi:hypothetical protein
LARAANMQNTTAPPATRPNGWQHHGEQTVTISKLPPHDSNGFYLPGGKPCPSGCYSAPHAPENDQVETALAYLSQLTPTKRPTYSSYYLKHRAESWGKCHGHSSYVSNGALIEAAIRLGLTIKPTGINAGIGVSVRDVKALCKKERSFTRMP